MRQLAYHALERAPVAQALQGQAAATLRPFERYLKQAIHSAKQRQVRFQLPFERVQALQTFRLEALDTLLLLPRPPLRWLLRGVAQPNPAQLLMIVNRDRNIAVEAMAWVDPAAPQEGVWVTPAEPLQPADRVFWCGAECQVSAEPAAALPAVCDQRGQVLEAQIKEHEDGLLLCVAGRGQALFVGGQPVAPASDHQGLQELRDQEDQLFLNQGGSVRTALAPAGLLRGDNGARYQAKAAEKEGRSGLWVQLLLPAQVSEEETLDPRASFCEEDLREVWTAPRQDPRTTIAVLRTDRERYQLQLKTLPPEGSLLFLPVNLRNLQRQRSAVCQLRDAPLPHHRGLLRLCEDPAKVRWPRLLPQEPARWHILTDTQRDGTTEQQRFVALALATPDLALLEGPPGSGKTTAICELILQLRERGQRVLLCASTHVAIDNVLEKLLSRTEDPDGPIEAVRIGRLERVDPAVKACQLDERTAALTGRLRALPTFAGLGDQELTEAAERTVLMAAELTCGTTLGILSHPLLRGRSGEERDDRVTMPHFDVLIIDEASKTTVPEFLVPALLARRWVIVGDVHQLPPFTDRAELKANLEGLVDDRDRPLLTPEAQRACLLRFRLARPELRALHQRWLVIESEGTLRRLADLLRGDAQAPSFDFVRSGVSDVALAAADWVLCPRPALRGATHLPPELLCAQDPCAAWLGEERLPESAPWLFRRAAARARQPRLSQPLLGRSQRIGTPQGLEQHEAGWLAEHDWAGELTWRLTRKHELRWSQGRAAGQRGLQEAIAALLPAAAGVKEAVEEIYDIGLPGVLEVLQTGIGEERSQRRSALTMGLREDAKEPRLGRLSYQHRMHPTISAFPRQHVYHGKALKDANTIAQRDAKLRWDFWPFPGPAGAGRVVFVDVPGDERGGVNLPEIKVMERVLRRFLPWAQAAGAPRRERPALWEVACLSFYLKQEGEIQRMLQRLTGDHDRRTRFTWGNVELVSGTVDRFQGREADLVFLSLRNTRRPGFLDSVNRLNVALTRARQLLVVIGNGAYFERCSVPELVALVKTSLRVSERGALQGAP